MEFEFLHLSISSNSDISDDEFYYVRQGEYTRFDSFDDIQIIKSYMSPSNKSDNSGQYFQYDSIDDIVIVNPEPETKNTAPYKADETDVNQNISPEFVCKFDEVVKEIKELQMLNPTNIEKHINPLTVLRKRLQTRMSNDFSKFAKRPSFLHKLKNEKYSGIFRRKSKIIYRTSSVPKIVVDSPNSPGHDTDSGNDSDSSDDVNIFKKQMDRLEKWSSNQKLYVSSKMKAMRKSI